jgi:AmiR/NasT family two-component response regulator
MNPSLDTPAQRFMRSAQLCRARDLKQLFVLSELVKAISELIHALQKERGASSIFLGSNAANFSDVLEQRIASSSALEMAVRLRLEELESKLDALSCSARFYMRVGVALGALEYLPRIRTQVRSLTFAPKDAVKVFTDVIATLLAVGFEAADIAADPDTSRALIALVYFAQGKEYAGQERAVGGAAWSLQRFDSQDHERLRRLEAAQQRAFQVFTRFADGTQVEALNRVELSNNTAALKKMRTAVLEAAGPEPPAISAAQWYEVSTQRIDDLKSIENAVTADLERICTAKLAQIQSSTRGQPIHEETRSAPLAMLITDQASPDSLLSLATGVGFRTDDALPKPLHTIMDVVEAQSRRIDDINAQLETARQALIERKAIERAKGILMSSRRLSEKDAYTLIRQTAMNQNKRIIEVAEAILSMADLLK